MSLPTLNIPSEYEVLYEWLTKNSLSFILIAEDPKGGVFASCRGTELQLHVLLSGWVMMSQTDGPKKVIHSVSENYCHPCKLEL